MDDLLLIFPPQWSPFQPALSLPSLSAWLKRAGFQVSSVDLNILFYQWLLSDECAEILIGQVEGIDLASNTRAAYTAMFANAHVFRDDVARLRDQREDGSENTFDYVSRNYLAIQALETYLDALSNIAQSFRISPHQFRLSSGNLRAAELEQRVARPPVLIESFLRAAIREYVEPARPTIVGLSCIGQEQLYFTLLLGRLLKQEGDAHVIVGGTIFSRIFERGALKKAWFDEYFDIIVRNEGEIPSERLLTNIRLGRPLTTDVPGIVFLEDGRIQSSSPCPPLKVSDLPIPDFDDLPLDRYISPEITLPLLSARGCYWGKCEFCHHGMVYGEKYAPYKAADLLTTITELSHRYNVRHFAFNDEALPPTTARAMARMFPPNSETGWTFTGLIKFESSYNRADFGGMFETGFRSLYVGLESASERVLELMRKRSKRETIVSNLTDATESGIWMHCFLFFGFPGETEKDAELTYNFIVENSAIVSSFGAGTFSLEHNAPIFHHYQDFGVKLQISDGSNVDVYYDYTVNNGISAERALAWQDRLQAATRSIESYSAAKWVPREQLLCMLSQMTPVELRQIGLKMRECGGLPAATRLQEVMIRDDHIPGANAQIVLNRANGRALLLRGSAVPLFELCFDHDLTFASLQENAPELFNRLAFFEARPE